MKYKVPNNVKNASKLLLVTIIKTLGGSSEVGNKTGFTRQAIHNYEVAGYFPLIQVYSVAKALNLKVWELSYAKLMEVFGAETPDFELLVSRLKILSPIDKLTIIKAYKK